MKLSLLNQTEDLDLISELVRLNQRSSDETKGTPKYSDNYPILTCWIETAERVTRNVISAYEYYCSQRLGDNVLVSPPGVDQQSKSHDWNLPQCTRAYGLALGTYL